MSLLSGWLRGSLSLGLILSLTWATGCTRRKEIWIYTSLPREVISEMVEPMQAAVPGADVKWYQSGSDNVASRLSTEMDAGKLKADLVIMSDPFWYVEMKQKGRLLPYDSPAARDVPAQFRDPDHAFAAMRLPMLVMAYNSNLLKPSELPERWKDLASPRFQSKVSMGSPLDSPAGLVALSALSKAYGWEYFAELRKLGFVAEGSHTSVVTRIETGERPIGILPLDMVLRASVHNRAIKPIYPLDGAIPVPGMVAILKETDRPEAAQQVYDWLFSPAAQNAIVHGAMYSPLPKMVSPDGARPWNELQNQLMPWSATVLNEMHAGRERTKAKFSEVVLH